MNNTKDNNMSKSQNEKFWGYNTKDLKEVLFWEESKIIDLQEERNKDADEMSNMALDYIQAKIKNLSKSCMEIREELAFRKSLKVGA